jgi:hypothetical protein
MGKESGTGHLAIGGYFLQYLLGTASITALNEFYRWRIFDGLETGHCAEKEMEIGVMEGSRDFESFPSMGLRLRSFICVGSFVVRRTDGHLGGLAADGQSPESDWSEE